MHLHHELSVPKCMHLHHELSVPKCMHLMHALNCPVYNRHAHLYFVIGRYGVYDTAFHTGIVFHIHGVLYSIIAFVAADPDMYHTPDMYLLNLLISMGLGHAIRRAFSGNRSKQSALSFPLERQLQIQCDGNNLIYIGDVFLRGTSARDPMDSYLPVLLGAFCNGRNSCTFKSDGMSLKISRVELAALKEAGQKLRVFHSCMDPRAYESSYLYRDVKVYDTGSQDTMQFSYVPNITTANTFSDDDIWRTFLIMPHLSSTCTNPLSLPCPNKNACIHACMSNNKCTWVIMNSKNGTLCQASSLYIKKYTVTTGTGNGYDVRMNTQMLCERENCVGEAWI
eukprot:GHVO01027074.1.p1 GENE.GHVO01027074.1~~GHVO01027074.1.p1  ORF type:complete len:338 (-),score=41.78 GHVO01027074.1:193-1206(-)